VTLHAVVTVDSLSRVEPCLLTLVGLRDVPYTARRVREKAEELTRIQDTGMRCHGRMRSQYTQEAHRSSSEAAPGPDTFGGLSCREPRRPAVAGWVGPTGREVAVSQSCSRRVASGVHVHTVPSVALIRSGSRAAISDLCVSADRAFTFTGK
jgi:hypothetical protein